jgi:hypothetical protein
MSEEIQKPQQPPQALATVSADDFASEAPVMELSLPVIKMQKNDQFLMPDESYTKELRGYIVFLQKTRSYFDKPFDGTETMPVCASSDGIKPDMGDTFQAATCDACPKSQYNEDLRKWECSVSYIALVMLEGQSIPHILRIRSTSCGKKSSLNKFFTNCFIGSTNPATGKWDGFATFKGAYQTVLVSMRLQKTKINDFDSSLLTIEKIDKVDAGSPTAKLLSDMYKALKEQFKSNPLKPERDAEPASDPDTSDCPV